MLRLRLKEAQHAAVLRKMRDLGIGIGHVATGDTLIDRLGANACRHATCNRVLDDERHAHVRLRQSRDHLRENPRGRTDDKRLSLDSLEPATHLVVDPAGVDDNRQQFAIRDDDDRLRPIW
jgi:hypothetical protein